jgi:hypothetical protein
MTAILTFLKALKQFAALNDITDLITTVNCSNKNICLLYLAYDQNIKGRPNNINCGEHYRALCDKHKDAVFAEIQNTTFDYLERSKAVIVDGTISIEIKSPPKVSEFF